MSGVHRFLSRRDKKHTHNRDTSHTSQHSPTKVCIPFHIAPPYNAGLFAPTARLLLFQQRGSFDQQLRLRAYTVASKEAERCESVELDAQL